MPPPPSMDIYKMDVEPLVNRAEFLHGLGGIFLMAFGQGWLNAGIKYFLPCQLVKIGIKWPKMAFNGLKWHLMA